MSRRRPSTNPLDGILLVDKEAGWTSHDVVAKVRRLSGERRIGHTGTLDPAATGLLVLCLGRATRLVEYIAAHEKRYTGRIVLGQRTTTDDDQGDVLEQRPVPAVSGNELQSLEQRFRGEISQVPPVFSAIKVEGIRAYAAAREGAPIDLKARTVRIERLSLTPMAPGEIELDVTCGAGTYIRSLARDIGEALGCGAHLRGLRRWRSGHFDVHNALTIGELETVSSARGFADLVLPPDEGLLLEDAIILAADNMRRLGQGQRIAPARVARPSVLARVYGAGGAFAGVASVGEDGVIRAEKIIAI